VATIHGEVIAGIVDYYTNRVHHLQYIGSSELGRENWAVGALITWMLTCWQGKDNYLDFGVSTEWAGELQRINEGLLRFKEGFGGGALLYDCYRIPIYQQGGKLC
jgi:hypothetical protein